MNFSYRTAAIKSSDNFGRWSDKKTSEEKVVALAGNPNVGKSTVFNSLTGLRQHTGNWPGKTVSNACGQYCFRGRNYTIVDIPGTYSLLANSAEEEIARDFICFGNPDAVVVVADSTCLERNLYLLLQILEITDRVVLCVNLMDEAKKKKIDINLELLSLKLGIPVVGTSARSGKGLNRLLEAVASVTQEPPENDPLKVSYGTTIETAVSMIEPCLESCLGGRISGRWIALKLLEGDDGVLMALNKYLCLDISGNNNVWQSARRARNFLFENGILPEDVTARVAEKTVRICESIAHETLSYGKEEYAKTDREIDKILTSKLTGIPIMLILLFGVFWLTIEGANLPSKLLSTALFSLESLLSDLFAGYGAPEWLRGALVDGVYRTLAWVISVMLPPMAIFFPLFTLLEDLGYLPRVAFNLDNYFRKACAHGKQALTMCMGFGCNAAGVTGCRIIDSPRERLIAIITNCFVPCNGRFPTLIAIITMFFSGMSGGRRQPLVSTLLLTCVIVLGVAMTLITSKLLSKTLLKGVPSSFMLELPPYRKPQIGKVIVRSVLDRTLFVLGRAAGVAAPAGLIIWLLANISTGGVSLLTRCAGFLDPFASFIGLDGYILLAFILGFPANEIVVPIIIMSYMSAGSLTELPNLAELHTLFVSHGWTWLTAVCTMLFSLMHWPCGTTFLTIRKETQSMKWAFAAFAVPTVSGIIFCAFIANAARLLGLA